jgi:hypothetical protein
MLAQSAGGMLARNACIHGLMLTASMTLASFYAGSFTAHITIDMRKHIQSWRLEQPATADAANRQIAAATASSRPKLNSGAAEAKLLPVSPQQQQQQQSSPNPKLVSPPPPPLAATAAAVSSACRCNSSSPGGSNPLVENASRARGGLHSCALLPELLLSCVSATPCVDSSAVAHAVASLLDTLQVATCPYRSPMDMRLFTCPAWPLGPRGSITAPGQLQWWWPPHTSNQACAAHRVPPAPSSLSSSHHCQRCNTTVSTQHSTLLSAHSTAHCCQHAQAVTIKPLRAAHRATAATAATAAALATAAAAVAVAGALWWARRRPDCSTHGGLGPGLAVQSHHHTHIITDHCPQGPRHTCRGRGPGSMMMPGGQLSPPLTGAAPEHTAHSCLGGGRHHSASIAPRKQTCGGAHQAAAHRPAQQQQQQQQLPPRRGASALAVGAAAASLKGAFAARCAAATAATVGGSCGGSPSDEEDEGAAVDELARAGVMAGLPPPSLVLPPMQWAGDEVGKDADVAMLSALPLARLQDALAAAGRWTRGTGGRLVRASLCAARTGSHRRQRDDAVDGSVCGSDGGSDGVSGSDRRHNSSAPGCGAIRTRGDEASCQIWRDTAPPALLQRLLQAAPGEQLDLSDEEEE